MSRRLLAASLYTLTSLVAPFALAADGVIEINQTCALAGCFSGDSAGFPVRLLTRGSYRLTSDLVVPIAASSGIEILADGTTLDLNGFSVVGAVACTGSGDTLACLPDTAGSNDGILATAHAVIRNGTVRGMGGEGIYSQRGGVIEDVILTGNGGFSGLLATSASVHRVVTAGNEGSGVYCTGCTVTDSVSAGNGSMGFANDTSTTLAHSAARANGGSGVYSIGGSMALTQYCAIVDNVGLGMAASNFDGQVAYGQNVIQDNENGEVNPGGVVQVGLNLCDGDLTCN